MSNKEQIEELYSSINYSIIENTDLSNLPIKNQVEIMLSIFKGSKIKLNKFLPEQSYFYCSNKSMEIFIEYEEEFSKLFYNNYSSKKEFFLEGTFFPCFFLSLIYGINSPYYSDPNYIISKVKHAQNLKMDISSLTSKKSSKIIKLFEENYLVNFNSFLQKGFSLNKNIVDLAILTLQYETAMLLMKPPFNIKPTISINLNKDDMLKYIYSLLNYDEDNIAAEQKEYKSTVEEMLDFYNIDKDKKSLYDIIFDVKPMEFIDFLKVLNTEAEKSKRSIYLDPCVQNELLNIVSIVEVSFIKYLKNIESIININNFSDILNELKKLKKNNIIKQNDIKELIRKMLEIEKSIIKNNISINEEKNNQKRL